MIQFCPAGSVLLDRALPGGVESLSRLLLRSITAVEIKSGGGGVTVYAEDGTFPRIFMGVDRPCRPRKYGEGERLVTVLSASTKSGVGARLGVPRLGVCTLWLLMLEDWTPGDLPESCGFDALRLPSGLVFNSRLVPLLTSKLLSVRAGGEAGGEEADCGLGK